MRSERWLWGAVTAAALVTTGGAAAPASAPPAVCFAPGTDPGYVRRTYAALQAGGTETPIVSLFQFNPGARWSTTASAGGLGQGAPTVLTWSVVPDGLIIPAAFSGDGSGPSTLRARLNAIYGSESNWRPIIQQAFDEWASRTGTSYVFENDDGASFSGSPGVLGVRGDIRISGRGIDGNFGILAYNFFPNNGDMVIDAPDSFYSDTSNSSIRLRNVLSHEHGHGLGINHVCPINQTKLMEPFFSGAFTGPQHDDTLAGQRGYGDNREDNDASAQGTNFGSIGNGTFNATGGGIDDNTDMDYYRFTVTAGKQVDVTVTPIGSTYLQGAQLSNGDCTPGTSFNSLTLSNLALEVLASNGTTVLATANGNPAGVAEALNNVALTSAGQFFIRVTGNADNVQLYNLSFTVEDSAIADLAITKTDGAATAVPGQTVTYTIVASNTSGTITANGATVVDNFPASLSGISWSCVASAGSSCIVTSGVGNINRTVNLLPGGTVTFTATGTVSAAAVGTLANTATVTPPSGVADPALANNTATDTDTLTPRADLAITKTDGQATAVPGAAVTYTITVTNPGPSVAPSATVTDTFPAAMAGVGWTCVASVGSTCAAPGGAGHIATTVTLLPGGTATFTATGTLSTTATGSLVNTASVSAPAGVTDPNAANNTATDTDTLTPQADLAVTKTDGQASAVPGTQATYTVTVSNAGPSFSGSATITDNFPAAFTGVSWTCAGAGGAACPAGGAGNIAAAVTLPPGGVATFTATGTIDPSATGSLANTATASVPAGVSDPAPGNNSATDTDALTPQADFRITKTDGQLSATPGGGITYTIQVVQGGPSAAGAGMVTDTFPAAIAGVTWTCTASAGSSCPPSGSGNISAPVTLLVGGTATFTANGTISAAATGTLSNTAQVTPPGSVTDPVSGNNSATDTDNLTLDLVELTHGAQLTRDLAGVGALPADHFYWLSQKPYSSYEVVVDGTSGDIGPTLVLQRLAGDGSTVLQQSAGASPIGLSRVLRFVNDRPVSQDGELLRVRSGGCGSSCGVDDVYRIRLRETTGRVARFNNSSTQITVAVLQNVSGGPLGGTIYFWRTNGTLAATHPFSLALRGTLVLNTSTLPGLVGVSGAVTIAHDGGYGGLAGKTVALEPATGFSFDSPMAPVIR